MNVEELIKAAMADAKKPIKPFTASKTTKKAKSSYDRQSGDENEPFLRNNGIRDIARFAVPQTDEGPVVAEVVRVRSDRVDLTDMIKAAMCEGRQKYERVSLRETSEPSKKSVKLACSTRKMLPANRVFKGLPGDSRNHTVDAIRAIAAENTGCIVRSTKLPELPKHQKATTHDYVQAGYQILRHKDRKSQ